MTQYISYLTFTAANMLGMREIRGHNMGEYIHVDPGAKVCDGIYIGSLATATSDKCLRDNNIGAIVNLSGTIYSTRLPIFNIIMDDADIMPDTLGEYLHKFSSGARAIREMRSSGKTVLVHCAAGINRSATLVAFYLIESGWSYDKAIAALVSANTRRHVPLLTNVSFRYLLSTHESITRNFDKKMSVYDDHFEFADTADTAVADSPSLSD